MKYSKEFINIFNILNNPHIFSKSFQKSIKVHQKSKSPLPCSTSPKEHSLMGNEGKCNGLLDFSKNKVRESKK